jgi:NitT/TauT family transport system substrate-binding protein
VEAFATDFRNAGILKKSTDVTRFANQVSLDVLA